MPGKIKVKILAGRNLPVMDRSGDTTDAYVEIKFGNTTYKTDVCRKSLNPQWNSEWYRFEVDDAELQDEPLQVRLMDHDTYSANDAIGKVYVNLNPLLLPGSPLAVKNIWTLEATMNSSGGTQAGAVMTGWIPVFDTMHGIRGEVNIIVKVELFSDCNKFRQSSCGVQFFYSPNIPHGYHAQVIHGFVEELVVSDDPEYKWIDKIRTPRASNEARQTLFFKMSGEVQRKIGLKALDLGGNAVIGYVQNFDLEGESGIVARGIGTAVTLVKIQEISSILPLEPSNIEDLTCFGLQTKNLGDFSESDDSLPLLANSPSHSPVPRSPINIRPTTVNPRFPKYEKSPKHQRRVTMRVAEYRAAAMRARQFSLQSSSAPSSGPMRKGIGSSLSLADDLISESSLKNMLALEDMRGEPASNPFSRGLKNFRYLHQNILPKRVAQIKSKFADSFDDESDPDSSYSSTWSLAGSESNRSSIVDLRQSIRRKKFTHKKGSANDGIAALLIRSVHTGFPLDSVKEDRETPAPSPVNFLVDTTEYNDDQAPRADDKEAANSNAETNKPSDIRTSLDDKMILTKTKLGSKYPSDRSIPMISSSESDTSTSDDDDPSESSTNYNILDETYSLVDPNSPDERPFPRRFSSSSKASKPHSNSHDSTLPPSSPIKIIKQSFESKNVAEIVPVHEEDSSLFRNDRSLESSTDYNILDDISLPPETKFSEDSKLETRPNSELTDFVSNTNIDPFVLSATSRVIEIVEPHSEIEEANKFSILSADSHSECSNDYHFLDDTQSLINPSLSDEDQTFSAVPLTSWFLASPYNEKNRQNLESETVTDVNQFFQVDSPFSENSISICQETSNPNDFHDDIDKAGSILSTNTNEIVQSVGEIEETKRTSGNENEKTYGNDEKLDSSTDYNVLDDTCSLNAPSSFDEENLDSMIRKSFENTNFIEIATVGDEISALCMRRIDVDAEVTKTLEKSQIDNDFSFDSQAERNLNSSTDYNVLEDTIDPEDSPKMIENLILPPVLKEIEKAPEKIENVEVPGKDHFVAPFSTDPSTISSSGEKSLKLSSPKTSLDSAPQSPSSGKLPHLKFLPKQKHFDSVDDPDFVTSTPVETDPTPPDFSPIEKSPESPGSKIWDFSTFPTIPRPELSAFNHETTSSDARSIVDLTNSKKLEETNEKQICPLGVVFDKVTMLSDSKTSKEPKISKGYRATSDVQTSVAAGETEKLQETDYSRSQDNPGPKNWKKTQKKVERTDTVIYKGPAKDREKTLIRSGGSRESVKSVKNKKVTSTPIPIVVAPPPEEKTTRLQVPVIQTTNINVQSCRTPEELKECQQFGANGASKKIHGDDFAISEKFTRKYRQHCMLDLIKTIDTKMMIHHMHHERRDSTRSKQRKKRERMNASATPSPDSIHRTRPHRRRSRSRSPDRHIHGRGHVSTLTTHSFPMKNSSTSNLIQDPMSSESCENISKNNVAAPPISPSKDSNSSEIENHQIAQINNERSSNNVDSVCSELGLNISPPEMSITSNNDFNNELEITIDPQLKTFSNLLAPKDSEHPVFKSHSAGTLEYFSSCSSPLITKTTNTPNITDDLCVPCSQLTHRQQDEQPSSPLPTSSGGLPSSLGSKVTSNASAVKNSTAVPNMHRRSSDSDLSITPKGNSLAGSDRSMGGQMRPSTAIVRTMNQDTMEMLEYPFITMQQYPPGFILNIGGLVSARSVKLLERITNLEEPEGRDAWWTEIRMEVRSHARALACNVVLGYKEEISICDDVCVLNASGTAAVINLLNASQDQDNALLNRTIMTTSVESEREKPQPKSNVGKTEKSGEETISPGQQQTQASGKMKRTSESNDHEIPYLPTLSACNLCHLPYSEASVPFRVDVSKCAICKRAKVPDVLFTTIELPENVPMTGRGVFLQAIVCKCKRDLRGELNAKEISDCLPFLEYELHSLLLNKLKVKGMNAIFGLKVQVSVGERLVIGMAAGTAVYLTALPTPTIPKIASGNSWHNEEQLAEIQKNLIETVKKNREFYRLKPIVDIENGRSITTSDTDESDEDLPDLDLGIGTKDACVLEVDDVEDMDRINLLMDDRPPDDFHVVNTQSIPGLEDLEIVRNLQMFTQISRAKIPAGQFASMPSKYFARMLQTVLFKLRRMVPCALCDMQFKVALPEQDEIQLSVIGMALGLGEPTRFSKYKRKIIPNSTSKDPVKKSDEADLIFSLDEDQADIAMGAQETMTNQSNTYASNSSPLTGLSTQKHRPRSPFRTRTHFQHRHKHVPLKERYGVDITPLSYLPGGKIERYLGNLNFFFIRESTSIRENGGLSGFTHSFVTEVLAIIRAHITALGGNAMVAFFMTQCVLLHSPHKNQGQCLINVGGDVVTVSYYGDEKYQANQNS